MSTDAIPGASSDAVAKSCTGAGVRRSRRCDRRIERRCRCGAGSLLETAVGPSVTLTGLTPGTDYPIQIEAFDAAGNESAPGTGLVLRPRIDVFMGANAHSVKGEDVNGDGVPDLVSAVAGDDWVSVLSVLVTERSDHHPCTDPGRQPGRSIRRTPSSWTSTATVLSIS